MDGASGKAIKGKRESLRIVKALEGYGLGEGETD